MLSGRKLAYITIGIRAGYLTDEQQHILTFFIAKVLAWLADVVRVTVVSQELTSATVRPMMSTLA